MPPAIRSPIPSATAIRAPSRRSAPPTASAARSACASSPASRSLPSTPSTSSTPTSSLAFRKAGELVGVELVDGVEGKDLDAGELAHALLAALAVGGALRLDGARIAVAEGIGERIAGGIDAHVVHGPAVDS